MLMVRLVAARRSRWRGRPRRLLVLPFASASHVLATLPSARSAFLPISQLLAALLDVLGRHGVIVDASSWCSFVAARHGDHEYRGFAVRSHTLTFALVLQLFEPTVKVVPFDSPRRREHNDVDDEA